MSTLSCLFLLLAATTLVLTADSLDTRREARPLRRRSWKDFWNGAKVAGTVAVLLGRRNTEAEKRKFTDDLPRPEVVDRDAIQKRIHTEDSATEVKRANYEGIKRDTFEGTDRVLITRNNFASANKKRRDEGRHERKINWWHAAAGAGLALLGRDDAEKAQGKRGQYIQERAHLASSAADEVKKRDAHDGAEHMLNTRDDSVNAEERAEARMEKRGWLKDVVKKVCRVGTNGHRICEII